jgi:hypothetical protein
MRLGAFLLTTMLLPAALRAQSQDEGHPLVKPFAGSTLLGRELKQFDEQPLVVGPVRGGVAKVQALEGKITRLDYQDPADRSSLERIRNYEQALAGAGFEIVFRCGRETCGESQVGIEGFGYFPQDRYVVARLSRPAGDVWVAVTIPTGPSTRIWIVETRPMETGMVGVNAGVLADQLVSSGHVAVYGILFDSGKADLKPESDAALKEISTLLSGNDSLSLHVVGHTDNVGGLEANLDLSTRRAAAVVAALTQRYGVAAARLRPSGVGPLAPVASNATDEGRARNRRVELVAQ